ncbi:hypothetical protein KFU94_26310 [Chloroflexi bacterium TSY]|nr:hypothetical protein [Chloroflexi bacterium TSY]
MNKTVRYFDSLSVTEINAQRPGAWGDYELLDVVHHFSEQKDDEREEAVRILLLRSPEVSEMILYSELYWEQMEGMRWRGDYSNALKWAYAGFAYGAQHRACNHHAIAQCRSD